MSENKSYYQELYAACKYIIDHIEVFKDYAIYNFVKYEVDLEENQMHQGEGIALKLHNRLLAQFKFLIGESEKKLDQTEPKGTDVVPKIDYHSLDTMSLAEMLAITDQFINEEGIHINYQMLKINVDKTIPMMDYLLEQIISADEYDELGRRWEYMKEKGIKNIPERKEYFKILEMDFILKRQRLNNECQNIPVSGVCEHFAYKLGHFYNRIARAQGSFPERGQCIRIESCFDARLYVDLCCKAILQYVIQGIIKNEKNRNKLESIKRMNKVIIECINVNMMECDVAEENTKLEKRPEENLFRFYFYFFARDGLLQDTKNLKKFAKPQNGSPKSVTRTLLTFFSTGSKKKSWEDIQNIFEEGYKKHNMKTFKQNVANCLCLIKRINMAIRENDIPYSPIRLKALYREFYLEKTQYSEGRKTGKTIVNEFLKNDNIQNAEYYYIREISNKGFFSEYGLLEEWYAKNELQENLYYLACFCLAKLNPLSVIFAFRQVVVHLFEEMCKLENECSDYARIPEEIYVDIGDFDLPMDCNNMTNEESKKIYSLLEKLFGISD